MLLPIVVVVNDFGSVRKKSAVNPPPKAVRTRIAASVLPRQHFGVHHFGTPLLKQRGEITNTHKLVLLLHLPAYSSISLVSILFDGSSYFCRIQSLLNWLFIDLVDRALFVPLVPSNRFLKIRTIDEYDN